MTINEYQKEAMRTASGIDYEHNGMLINAALGLCGESGEVADIVKKATFTIIPNCWEAIIEGCKRRRHKQ